MLNSREANPRKRRILRCGLLSAASLLCLAAAQPAGAQTTEDGYVAGGVTPSQSAAPLANSVTAAETVLPPSYPDYFAKAYPLYMRSPLPARIYNQGGIPAVVPQLEIDRNELGRNGTYLPGGPVYTADNAFFQSLGTNGRSCATCHQPPSGMSISVRNVKARFNATKGTDPIFSPNDGANCPSAVPAAHTSGSPYGGLKGKGKKALKDAYSLLLSKGLIRIFFPVLPDAEFDISIVSDKPGCNSDPEFGLPAGFVSVYRRPLMSAQLNFKTHRPDGTGPASPLSIMWDGREPSLEQQAVDATLGHAQADHPPTPEEVAEIVAFENTVFSAQILDKQAKALDEPGATGGPVSLSQKTPFDLAGLFAAGFPPPFNEYDAWAGNSQRQARLDQARAGHLQHAVVHRQQRRGHQRRVLRPRRAAQQRGPLHLRPLPQPEGRGRRRDPRLAPRHRARRAFSRVRRESAGLRPAGPQADLQARQAACLLRAGGDHQRPGPRPAHRQVLRYRPAHGAAASRPGLPPALLQRRLGARPEGGGRVLQHAVQHRPDRRREGRPDQLPGRPLGAQAETRAGIAPRLGPTRPTTRQGPGPARVPGRCFFCRWRYGQGVSDAAGPH